MIVTLDWRGPIGAGRFPADLAALEALDAPGVYLRIKSYDGGRRISYVGQSVSLLARIDQHITALLSLQAPVRDSAGAPLIRGDFADRLAAYGDIAAASAAAADEAARMTFFVAPCDDEAGFRRDHLNLVEGALKARLEAHAAARAGLAHCENVQGVPRSPFEGVIAIESDFTALAPDDAETLGALLGADPIEIPEAALGLGHAE